MKRLLIVYHTQGGRTGAMAGAVLRGARRATETETVMKRAGEATLEDLLGCQGLVIGTPENFGTMAGMVKDFFDRTYYPAEGKTVGLPYALFVSAGNDGSGANNLLVPAGGSRMPATFDTVRDHEHAMHMTGSEVLDRKSVV